MGRLRFRLATGERSFDSLGLLRLWAKSHAAVQGPRSVRGKHEKGSLQSWLGVAAAAVLFPETTVFPGVELLVRPGVVCGWDIDWTGTGAPPNCENTEATINSATTGTIPRVIGKTHDRNPNLQAAEV